jgi:hypothetical protein
MANRDKNISTGTSTSGVPGDWIAEEQYWRTSWSTRPYVSADRGFEYYEPGYRYGYEAANRHRGRDWNDVESDLRSGWDKFEHRGKRTWENMKDAVRDAWNRVTKH